MISARQNVIFICFLLVLDAVILCRRRSDVVTFVAVTVGFALVGCWMRPTGLTNPPGFSGSVMPARSRAISPNDYSVPNPHDPRR